MKRTMAVDGVLVLGLFRLFMFVARNHQMYKYIPNKHNSF